MIGLFDVGIRLNNIETVDFHFQTQNTLSSDKKNKVTTDALLKLWFTTRLVHTLNYHIYKKKYIYIIHIILQ